MKTKTSNELIVILAHQHKIKEEEAKASSSLIFAEQAV